LIFCPWLHSLQMHVYTVTALHSTPPLHSTPFHSTQLRSTTLYSTPHNCTSLHSTKLYSTPLHCTALQSTPLHFTALHSTPLDCTALRCTNRHSIPAYKRVFYSISHATPTPPLFYITACCCSAHHLQQIIFLHSLQIHIVHSFTAYRKLHRFIAFQIHILSLLHSFPMHILSIASQLAKYIYTQLPTQSDTTALCVVQYARRNRCVSVASAHLKPFMFVESSLLQAPITLYKRTSNLITLVNV
jgi:hypothetical protein